MFKKYPIWLFATFILTGCSTPSHLGSPSEQFAKSDFAKSTFGCSLKERIQTNEAFREKAITLLGRVEAPRKTLFEPEFFLDLHTGSAFESQVLHVWLDTEGNGSFRQGKKGSHVSFYSIELANLLKGQRFHK